jgi:ABC-type lipoprotein export system ATPase subunit
MGLPLSVSDLQVSGDDGRIILVVDELFVHPGMCLGVRGPSGAGKSTLLFAMAGLANVTGGKITWGGTTLSTLSEERRAAFRRKTIGIVFQDFLLFEELSATANASLAGTYSEGSRQAAIAERAAWLLKRLGIPPSTRTVANFSGGERQRVAIARALATDPSIVLADEPSANLDRDAADRLIDDLVRLARDENKTLIAVSHDPAVHVRMDRMIDIVDGRMVTG